MPKVSDHKQAHLRRFIRDAMAVDPLITMAGIKRVLLQRTGMEDMDNHFLKRLIRKVTSEMVVVADREKVETRIMQLRERNRFICEELIKMAIDPMNDVSDRRAAFQAVARIENAQVKIEMDLGLFTRKIGEVDLNLRMKPVEPDRILSAMTAFKAWGSTAPPMRRIEPERVVTVESTSITNEPTKPQPTATPAPAAAIIPIVTGAGLVTTE